MTPTKFAKLCTDFEQAEKDMRRAFNRYVKLQKQCERASKALGRKNMGGKMNGFGCKHCGVLCINETCDNCARQEHRI